MEATSHTRRAFLQAVGLGAAAFAARGARGAGPGAKKPNVLFIFTDDQREDTIGALGNPHIHTPNLDALVRSGTAFTNTYCMGGFSGAVCLPSRMMMLRGRSWFSVRNLPKGFPNFPTSMNEAGYETCHLGKKGNTDRQVHTFFAHNTYVSRGPEPGKPQADGAIEFLRSRKRDKPFFLYLSGPAPHDPRVAPKEYMDRYDAARIPVPPNFMPFHPFDNGEMTIRDERLAPWPRTETEIRRHLRDYYAMITHLDAQLGRVFQALKDTGDYDNTIIIFASDQGIAVGSHGLMGKQNLYEHSMGVPLIFSGPGIPKGRKADAFAYLFDVFPTVCDLVGAPVPKGLEGKSLAPILRGHAQGVRDTVFLAYRSAQRAVRRGRWKLIQYPQINTTQLFDLADDPAETKNLASNPAHAGTVKELMAIMAEQQKLFRDTVPLKSDAPRQGKVDLRFFERQPARQRERQKAARKAKKRKK